MKGWRYSTTVDYLANTCKAMIQIPSCKRKKAKKQKTDREPMELAQQVKILATKFGNLYSYGGRRNHLLQIVL